MPFTSREKIQERKSVHINIFAFDTKMGSKHIKDAYYYHYQGNANQTIMRYHFLPTRLAIIKIITSDSEDVEKLELLCSSWWECQMVKPLWKIVWWFLK